MGAFSKLEVRIEIISWRRHLSRTNKSIEDHIDVVISGWILYLLGRVSPPNTDQSTIVPAEDMTAGREGV